ncbi:MAG: DNA polymerase III subunit gamma/tau [Elusimicrobiaceae bacterium]|nr:DNA polymerase III subunit gamma/tau [Elusimicrobiaceae bacterium]MBT3954912.1 DNA polymerase III subunit gamma/tau [Elusimicrobiaceae bacterium]MBT4008562.1 DNA polymerase III subunit gamma/tau [Elusimicrobiaceae bacterium]MBT4403000.1 DNA polymerase III subunit gamma/tau [Elusimicrobiaceae bacterium]MBT4439728.1 DNA polymerase III subunit gamma/tau [Elusimicrobiaceae bacterium]
MFDDTKDTPEIKEPQSPATKKEGGEALAPVETKPVEIKKAPSSDHAYVNLANKFRPQGFEEVIGQEGISKTLSKAIELGRIAHAYMFYGPRGCGKTTTARILAKALNCTGTKENRATASPCGKCPQCIEISKSSDLDVLELDAASNTQVEKIREAIIDTVALASVRDRYKIFILDEVHMLSASSFNALLKTIEEPPSHVVFILATTERHKVPATILSRCQSFRFKPISHEDISARLQHIAKSEDVSLSDDAAELIARNSGGALRDALVLMDRAISFVGTKITGENLNEMLGVMPKEIIRDSIISIINKDSKNLHDIFNNLKKEGYDAHSYLKDLRNVLGDLFYFSLGTTKEPLENSKEITAKVSSGYLADLTRKITALLSEMKNTDLPFLAVETGIFTIMNSSLDIEKFVKRLESLETSTAKNGDDTKPQETVAKPVAEPVKYEAKEQEVQPTPQVKETPVTYEAKPENVSNTGSASMMNFQPMPAMEPQKQQTTATMTIEKTDIGVGIKTTINSIQKEAVETPEDDKTVWKKMLINFSQTNPFLHEMMTKCSAEFKEGNKWQLSFNDNFYKETAERREKDFQNFAKKVSGQNINFQFILNPNKPSVEANKQIKNTIEENSSKDSFSKEQPFVDNMEILASANPVEDIEVSQDVKDILDIIPGKVIN